MKYFYFNKIKINLNLEPQTAPSGRQFVLSGCISDLKNSNYKFNYYTYIFKYLDKVKFAPDHKATTECASRHSSRQTSDLASDLHLTCFSVDFRLGFQPKF